MAKKPERMQKKVSFDRDLEDVKDYTVDDEAYDFPHNDVLGVRRAISECSDDAGRSRKEVHFRVRSVTFAAANDDEATVRRRLCRTPTPFWPRSDAPSAGQVSDGGSMDDDFCVDEEGTGDTGGDTADDLLSPQLSEGRFTVPSPQSSPSAKRAFLAKKPNKFSAPLDNST